MKASQISTTTLTAAPRAQIPRIQRALAEAAKEVSTGRYADVGLALGDQTARSLALRRDSGALQSLIDGNVLASTRLERSQGSLTSLLDQANGVLRGLVSAGTTTGAATAIRGEAESAFGAFVDLVNTADGGRYLFAGINSAIRPLNDPAAGRSAIASAAASAFGLPLPDPAAGAAVAEITPAAMADFLDGAFADLFDEPAWSATWSTASDRPLTTRISDAERIETSVTANEPGLRKLAMAYSMLSELGIDRLPEATRQVVVDKARTLVGAAVTGLTAIQGRLGVAQARVQAADERMTLQRDAFERRLAALEGVDPLEAKTRIDTLSVQIEMSYSLTAKLMKLSILNYV